MQVVVVWNVEVCVVVGEWFELFGVGVVVVFVEGDQFFVLYDYCYVYVVYVLVCVCQLFGVCDYLFVDVVGLVFGVDCEYVEVCCVVLFFQVVVCDQCVVVFGQQYQVVGVFDCFVYVLRVGVLVVEQV